MPEISVIIPARNEALRLPATIRTLRARFPTEPWEFLLVIQTGEDGTENLARKEIAGDPRFKILRQVARGKGLAVQTGMLAAKGDITFFMDADLSVPPEFIQTFTAEMHANPEVDVLIGSRRHKKSVIQNPQPASREISGRIFNLAIRLAGLTSLRDTQCGFKAFRQAAAKAIFPKLTQSGFGFDVEALSLAEALGLTIKEMPVVWTDMPGSQLKPLDGIAALIACLKTKRKIG